MSEHLEWFFNNLPTEEHSLIVRFKEAKQEYKTLHEARKILQSIDADTSSLGMQLREKVCVMSTSREALVNHLMYGFFKHIADSLLGELEDE